LVHALTTWLPNSRGEPYNPVNATAPSEHNDLEQSQNPFSPPVRIVATRRRRRTVAARLRSGVLELLVPEWMPHTEREMWAENMRKRIERRMRRRPATDEQLAERARLLNKRHFGGRLRWHSVSWHDMSNWGDCSVMTGDIRIAKRAKTLPTWVLDYLLTHEMAHLEHGDHGPGFHEMVSRYPLTERAKGYLLAVDTGALDG
jgi:predicted metal-dependent hydrolase